MISSYFSIHNSKPHQIQCSSPFSGLCICVTFQDFSDITYSSTPHQARTKVFHSTRAANKLMGERKEHNETRSPPSSLSSAPRASLPFLPHTWQQGLCSSPQGFPSVSVLGFKLSLTSPASLSLGSWERASSLCYFFFTYFCANNLNIPGNTNPIIINVLLITVIQ